MPQIGYYRHGTVHIDASAKIAIQQFKHTCVQQFISDTAVPIATLRKSYFAQRGDKVLVSAFVDSSRSLEVRTRKTSKSNIEEEYFWFSLLRGQHM